MLIDSMTGSELMKEYHADYSSLLDYAMKLNCSPDTAKLFKRLGNRKLVSVCRQFTTARKNRYLTILVYTKLEDMPGNNWDVVTVFLGLMRTHKGDAAVGFFDETQQAMVFTPHFFKRYKERILDSCDWHTKNRLVFAKTTRDIASIYVTNNKDMVWMNTQSVFGDKAHIFSPTDDGVALMQWDSSKKRLQANTFLTYDMLDEKQTAMVEYAKDYMKSGERPNYEFEDFVAASYENNPKLNKQS